MIDYLYFYTCVELYLLQVDPVCSAMNQRLLQWLNRMQQLKSGLLRPLFQTAQMRVFGAEDKEGMPLKNNTQKSTILN